MRLGRGQPAVAGRGERRGLEGGRGSGGKGSRRLERPSWLEVSSSGRGAKLARPRDPPGLANDPPGLANDPPGLANDPPGLANDPPGLANDPPGLANDPPGLANDPPGL